MSIEELFESSPPDGRRVSLMGVAYLHGFEAQIPFEEFAPGSAGITFLRKKYGLGTTVPVTLIRCFVAAPGLPRCLDSRSGGVLLCQPGLGAHLWPWGTLGVEVPEVGPITVVGRIMPSTVEPYWGMLTEIKAVEVTIDGKRRHIDLDAAGKPNPEHIESRIRSGWSSADETESYILMKTAEHSFW